ncbi:MAG: methylmalonyl Co-A mutase-associated GTPase MeaB [Gammaproteobacteria bacterium]|nr:methylmalonyl Co-A mutase-associated GTPase MeaB [Gammaproteobacteria bacterium]
MLIDDVEKAELTHLFERMRGGTTSALSRCLSIAEKNLTGAKYLGSLARNVPGNAITIGLTGAPGVGKSTLTAALIEEWRKRELSVGVIAIDPSSPVYGGAVLGDRIRMATHDLDDGVFVRSLASRRQLGGLAPAATRIAEMFNASGRDVILVETVGVGQSEVDVTQMVKTTVVICAPGMGDAVQTLKGGILEVADILVVNKADLPLASQAQNQLLAMIAMRSSSDWKVPVLLTQADNGAGMEQLVDACIQHQSQL